MFGGPGAAVPPTPQPPAAVIPVKAPMMFSEQQQQLKAHTEGVLAAKLGELESALAHASRMNHLASGRGGKFTVDDLAREDSSVPIQPTLNINFEPGSEAVGRAEYASPRQPTRGAPDDRPDTMFSLVEQRVVDIFLAADPTPNHSGDTSSVGLTYGIQKDGLLGSIDVGALHRVLEESGLAPFFFDLHNQSDEGPAGVGQVLQRLSPDSSGNITVHQFVDTFAEGPLKRAHQRDRRESVIKPYQRPAWMKLQSPSKVQRPVDTLLRIIDSIFEESGRNGLDQSVLYTRLDLKELTGVMYKIEAISAADEAGSNAVKDAIDKLVLKEGGQVSKETFTQTLMAMRGVRRQQIISEQVRAEFIPSQ